MSTSCYIFFQCITCLFGDKDTNITIFQEQEKNIISLQMYTCRSYQSNHKNWIFVMYTCFPFILLCHTVSTECKWINYRYQLLSIQPSFFSGRRFVNLCFALFLCIFYIPSTLRDKYNFYLLQVWNNVEMKT